MLRSEILGQGSVKIQRGRFSYIYSDCGEDSIFYKHIPLLR